MMVLAGAPRVLLLDEPTAGMGGEEEAVIMELIVGAVERRGATMVSSSMMWRRCLRMRGGWW